MRIIGEAMCRNQENQPNIFYAPLLSGTAYGSVKSLALSSGHPVVGLQHKLLSPGLQVLMFFPSHLNVGGKAKIFRELSKKPNFHWLQGWERDKHFRWASSLIGGWPRPLEFYLETLNEECKKKSCTLEGVDINGILTTTLAKIQNRYCYLHDHLPPEDANFIMAAAVSNLPIQRCQTIHPKVRSVVSDLVNANSLSGHGHRQRKQVYWLSMQTQMERRLSSFHSYGCTK